MLNQNITYWWRWFGDVNFYFMSFHRRKKTLTQTRIQNYSINYSLLCLSNICVLIYVYISLLFCVFSLCFISLLPKKLSFFMMVPCGSWENAQEEKFSPLTFELVVKGHIKESYIYFCVWMIARILFRFRSIRSYPTPP